MKEAVADGVDLRGYTPWGCIDLVSASTGEMANAMDSFMWINMMMERERLRVQRKIHFVGIRM